MDQYVATDLPTGPLRGLLETPQPNEVETVESVSSGTTGDDLRERNDNIEEGAVGNDQRKDVTVVAGWCHEELTG